MALSIILGIAAVCEITELYDYTKRFLYAKLMVHFRNSFIRGIFGKKKFQKGQIEKIQVFSVDKFH